jgi:hypothetical protein
VNETEDLMLMTNLYPSATGLPMVVWVGPSYGAPHDARIKVMEVHGTRMDLGNLAVVALRPRPHVVAGHLTAGDFASGQPMDRAERDGDPRLLERARPAIAAHAIRAVQSPSSVTWGWSQWSM